MYSKQEIENIDIAKVLNSLNIIEKYKIDKYLIHGDFGTHNFLVNNEKIKVIDPMGVVGDYLYDFYFAILSNVDIFMNLDIDRILGYYDRDIEYKKALFLIVLYIRMSRAFKYDKDNFKDYLSLYERIE
jgi:streptomycin 6-kinase